VACNVKTRLPCDECAQTLTTDNANYEPNSALFHILTIPSSDTVQISKEDEQCYKQTEKQKGFTSMTVSAVTQKVVN